MKSQKVIKYIILLFLKKLSKNARTKNLICLKGKETLRTKMVIFPLLFFFPAVVPFLLRPSPFFFSLLRLLPLCEPTTINSSFAHLYHQLATSFLSSPISDWNNNRGDVHRMRWGRFVELAGHWFRCLQELFSVSHCSLILGC